MNDEWPEIRLGDVLSLEYGKSLPERVRTGHGSPVFGSNGVVGYHDEPLVTGPGIIVGRKGTAGSVTWSDEDFFPIDTTYWVKLSDPKRQDLKYAALALESLNLPAVTAQTGVPGLNRERAYDLTLPLPPLAVQRRIVDLMEQMDNQVNQAVASQQAASRLLHRFLDEWVASSPAGEQSVGDLCKFRSGPSWAAADEATVPGADRTPVVKITNTRPDGTLDLQQLVYVRGLPASGHRLDDNSLIVIRTNGNRDRIGNVYRPSEDAIGCAVSAFQFSGSALSTTSRDFLYWFLKAPSTQQSMSEAASGTTGLGNLAARWLNSLPIPAAGNEEIKEFVAIANCLGHLSDVLLSEHAALTDLRGACLQALLSGQVTLPASYDELLGVAS